jgi:high-affinity nickel-transport protein
VGAETGSQVLLFAAAAGATSTLSGTLLLVAFVVGLLVSNSAITLGSVLGFSGSRTHRIAYVGLGVVTAVFSLTVGTIFLLARASVLPSILV